MPLRYYASNPRRRKDYQQKPFNLSDYYFDFNRLTSSEKDIDQQTMTKPPAAAGSIAIHEKSFEAQDEGEIEKYSNVPSETKNSHTQISPLGSAIDGKQNLDQEENEEEEKDDYHEPLGYQSFLYDVKIEYSPGGNRSTDSLGSKHCFKMKCLPYMMGYSNKSESPGAGLSSLSLDDDETTSDMTDCDGCANMLASSQQDEYEMDADDQRLCCTPANRSRKATPSIDVFRETCAFLGNSDFVPNVHRRREKRVIVELVSAKLSQSNGYAIPPDSSYNSLSTLAEDSALPTKTTTTTTTNTTSNSDSSSLRSNNSFSSSTGTSNATTDHSRTQVHFSSPVRRIAPPAAPPLSSPSSSKKFVNYTILIKTIPGLDKNPAVIERRFSDFLNLYQGLKTNETHAQIVDSNVRFPKKVYMGNFCLEKIAERSIEFTRLVHLCMSEPSLMWSVHFISFLVDKELKEAHRLSLFGDPDDVQTLIENVYYIQKKLYVRLESSSSRCGSSSSSLASDTNLPSPALPKVRLDATSPNLITRPKPQISANHTNSCTSSPINAQQRPTSLASSENSSASNGSGLICDTSDHSNSSIYDKSVLSPVNQRILVTFCMLFVTYCRSNNYRELKQVVRKFSQVISSREYVDSLLDTRHYKSLRASLLFLMNMTHGSVIDDGLRLLLKKKLEYIDGANADSQHLANALTGNCVRSLHDYESLRVSNQRGTTRITKNDLTSLLRDRNFCLFQDGKP